MDQLTDLQAAILAHVGKFVERQQLVLDAMRILRPDKVMRVEGKGRPEEISRLTQKYMRTSQVGRWQNSEGEWDYFLHGNGCRLTHVETAEIIQWDLGSLKCFDKHWFIDYLRWYIDTHDDDLARSVIAEYDPKQRDTYDFKQAIQFVLKQLSELGYLSEEKRQRYYLLWKRS